METDTSTGRDRRQSSRRKKSSAETLRVSFEERPGYPRTEVIAVVTEVSDEGCRIKTLRPLGVGSIIYFDRNALFGEGKSEIWTARITWCSLEHDGGYNSGVQLQSVVRPRAASGDVPLTTPGKSIPDHYELLQLNPKADPETIHRVYRMLAQRFHPDNPDSGNELSFRKLLEAYRVLSDPEQRAAYDIQYNRHNQRQWKIFDQSTAMNGIGAEKRTRTGILLVLYTRRRNEPAQPAVTVHEMEDLLGCPKEHLEFGLWFLREKGYLTRSDNGKFTITASGVEAAEEADIPWTPTERLLTAPAKEA